MEMFVYGLIIGFIGAAIFALLVIEAIGPRIVRK